MYVCINVCECVCIGKIYVRERVALFAKFAQILTFVF